MLSEQLTSDQLSSTDGQTLTSRAGLSLTVQTRGDTIRVVPAGGEDISTVVERDILATNGVLHKVDWPLLPSAP